MSTTKKPRPSLRASPLSLRAKRSNPVENLLRLDCFVALLLAMTTVPMSLRAKRSNPVEGLRRLDCFVAIGNLPWQADGLPRPRNDGGLRYPFVPQQKSPGCPIGTAGAFTPRSSAKAVGLYWRGLSPPVIASEPLVRAGKAIGSTLRVELGRAFLVWIALSPSVICRGKPGLPRPRNDGILRHPFVPQQKNPGHPIGTAGAFMSNLAFSEG
ncbi:MAG: hypothetical protein LBT00_05480 [Spirochaetaceae bacterium]|nr:hypothetical protein [Spirochaetaceae bacterium]